MEDFPGSMPICKPVCSDKEKLEARTGQVERHEGMCHTVKLWL